MIAPAKPGGRERTFTWQDPASAAAQVRNLSGRQWLEALRDGLAAPPPSARLLDMTVERVDDDGVVFSMQPAEFHYNPARTVHGGIIATIADTAMTTTVISKMPAGSWAPTIELKVNFIRPVTEATGRIYAVGRVIHFGGSTAVAEARIVDAGGTLYAHAISTCALKRGDA